MFSTSIDKGQLQNIETLAKLIDTIPAKLQRANDRAAKNAKTKIEANLRKRGRPGKFIQMDYKKYGPLGLKFSFEIRPGKGGHRGGNANRRYRPLIASKIFLFSEQGVIGRRAFVLRPMKDKKGGTKRYVVSHSSGEWRKGQKLLGPLRIPQIGPFYFSTKSGMPRKKIQKMAAEIIREELDKQYQKELGKIMR